MTIRAMCVSAVAALLWAAPASNAKTVKVFVQYYSFYNESDTDFEHANAPTNVSVGDTVQWIFNDNGVVHTVTSGANRRADGLFDSGNLSTGIFEYTFTSPGTFEYYCRPHFGMQSEVVVAPSTGGPPRRELGGASDNAVAVARSGESTIAAVVAGTKLYLLNTLDPALGDMPNWGGGKELGATVAGRPAFGGSADGLVVAVGTTAGRALVFNVASGNVVGDVSMGATSLPNAPAIIRHGAAVDVYWTAQTATGPALIRTRANDVVSTDSLGGSTSTAASSPAIFSDILVTGTSAEVRAFRVDPATGVVVPQASLVSGNDFNTSPVITKAGQAIVAAADGKVYKLNVLSGSQDGAPLALPAAAAPVSSPFYDAGSDTAYFGGADGRVYRVTANAAGSALVLAGSDAFGAGAVSMPAVAGATVYAADAAGNFGPVGGAAPLALGAAAGKAVALTGTAGGTNAAVVNTVTGAVVAAPLP